MEGGDVMMVGDTFYIGKSARTNEEGIKQFAEILGKYGYTVMEVPLVSKLHLGQRQSSRTGRLSDGGKIVKVMGYEVILVDISEFRKIDGGLSCLSLRFTSVK